MILNICAILFSILGTIEMMKFFKNKGCIVSKAAPFFGGIIPLTSYLEICSIVQNGTLQIVILLMAGFILTKEAFVADKKKIENILPKVSASIMLLLYPGLFISYFIRISSLSHPSESILIFFAMIFTNDILAYSIGSLFGNRSRKIVLVSPKKSLTGFIGGYTGSILIGFLSWYFLPYLFNGIISALIMGACIGITTILGDLIESAMKRSAETKDSGDLLYGRGGVLDSTDSILFSAPLFYYLIQIL